MPFLIGTDEAGYGPNLGPLVISATVWEVPDRVTHDDLYDVLVESVTPERDGSDRVWMADSKRVYKPNAGLENLELGVLSAMAAAGHSIDRWQRLFQELVADRHYDMAGLPWYADYDESLPIDATRHQMDTATARLVDGLSHAGIRLVKVVSRTIFPPRFNQSLQELDNKSAILSHETIQIVSDLIGSMAGPISVLCDKHGGRNKYAGLLQHHFSDGFVKVVEESRQSSRYTWNFDGKHVHFEFQAKADHVLAAALASMTSKYLRELAMRAFNRFWRRQKNDLKPTKGYPLDARRFKKQIAHVQAGLGISDQVLWRKK